MDEQLLKNGVDYIKELINKLKDGGVIDKSKKGSRIYIKPQNEGKFTKSAKEAGESVQEHATHVLNDPNATTLLKRRANFAKNAKKWNH